MVKKGIRYASVSAARNSGLIKKLSERFVSAWKGSDQPRSKSEVFDGFIIRHSKIGDTFKTVVFDKAGYFLEFRDLHTYFGESIMDGAQVGASTAYERDVLAPYTPAPSSLSDTDSYSSHAAGSGGPATRGLYPIPEAFVELTSDFSSSYIFSKSRLGDGFGFSITTLLTSAGSRYDQEMRIEEVTLSYYRREALPTHQFVFREQNLRVRVFCAAGQRKPVGGQLEWIAFAGEDGKATSSYVNVMSPSRVFIHLFGDSMIAEANPEYVIMDREVPITSNGYSNVIYESKLIAGGGWILIAAPRQLPVPCMSAIENCAALVMPVTTERPVTDFEYGCGKTGVFVNIYGDTEHRILRKGIVLEGSDFLPEGVEIEEWDASRFASTTALTEAWVEVIRPDGTFANVLGTVVDGVAHTVVRKYLNTGMPLTGYMPSSMGSPTVVTYPDRVEVFIDYRVYRSHIDTRGIDARPDMDVTRIQTQTGVVKVTIPYSIENMGGIYENFNHIVLGDIERATIVSDVSGSVGTSYADLGGDREDYHRLYRMIWSGNVGGKSVSLVSIVKHQRWEVLPSEIDPETGHFTRPIFSAQNNMAWGVYNSYAPNMGYNFLTGPGSDWILEYQSPVRIDGIRDTSVSWMSAVAVGIIVDDVITELEVSDTGWCLIRACTPEKLINDDWYWEDRAQKWAVAAGKDEIAFIAYKSTPEHMLLSHITTQTAMAILLNTVTFEWEVLREDEFDISTHQPALFCYSQKVIDEETGEVVANACFTYSIGSQKDQKDWIDVSTDSGATWFRVKERANVPKLGATFIGNELWRPRNGEVFRDANW